VARMTVVHPDSDRCRLAHRSGVHARMVASALCPPAWRFLGCCGRLTVGRQAPNREATTVSDGRLSTARPS